MRTFTIPPFVLGHAWEAEYDPRYRGWHVLVEQACGHHGGAFISLRAIQDAQSVPPSWHPAHRLIVTLGSDQCVSCQERFDAAALVRWTGDGGAP